MTRRAALPISVLMLLAGSSGCGDGMLMTSRERQETQKRILENDMKQITDDWDAFWLNDRPGRLTWSRVE